MFFRVRTNLASTNRSRLLFTQFQARHFGILCVQLYGSVYSHKHLHDYLLWTVHCTQRMYISVLGSGGMFLITSNKPIVGGINNSLILCVSVLRQNVLREIQWQNYVDDQLFVRNLQSKRYLEKSKKSRNIRSFFLLHWSHFQVWNGPLLFIDVPLLFVSDLHVLDRRGSRPNSTDVLTWHQWEHNWRIHYIVMFPYHSVIIVIYWNFLLRFTVYNAHCECTDNGESDRDGSRGAEWMFGREAGWNYDQI